MSAEKSLEDRFVATLSHEIRTPLNGILGMASLLAETPLSASQMEYVSAIRESGSRLLDLLNNVLDYARLDAAELALEESQFDPAQLAREVCELLSPRAHAKALDIAVRVTPAVPAQIESDAGRIRQILFNLIGNAIKFTDQGGVLIDLDIADNEAAPALTFRVRDSGAGIDPDKQDELFAAFRQNDASDAQKDGGVGLGLAIVQRLSEALGGTVTIDSVPGFGASFVFSLPTERGHLDPAARAASDRYATSYRIGLHALPPVTALSVAATLAQAGHRVVNLETGTPQDEHIDLILADAATPPEVLKSLARKAPLLTVLRPEDRSMISHFRDMGSVGYLIRPLRPQSLIEQIEATLRGNAEISDDGEPEAQKKLTILVADDNPVNALLATRVLERDGHHCIKAMTGAEAVSVAESQSLDVILMDLRMPVMDGFKATALIRGGGGLNAATPIIAVSAEVNPQVEADAKHVGFDAIAAKPLDAERLRSMVARWTNRTQDHDRSGFA